MNGNENYFEENNSLIDYESALMGLPDKQLWIWLMHRKGYTQDDIGGRLGVTQSDVAYHIGKVTKYLEERLR